MALSRRSFLASATAVTAATSASAVFGQFHTPAASRIDVALIGTMVKKLSHTQHFMDRLGLGYSWGGQWIQPARLVSAYIDQYPKGDLARARAKKYGTRLCTSIAEALTLGTGSLAVDGVFLIGEHGDYPVNELGQTLYPRYKFFKEIVKVFEASGRSVPVFNDKHLSTNWKECVEMVRDAERLRFPFMAGSSLPVTHRLPAVDVPWGTKLSESVVIGYGGVDSYDFHGLETAQCMSERRRGGETGVKSVQVLRGKKAWDHLDRKLPTRQLLQAALNRSHSLPVEDGYMDAKIDLNWAKRVFPEALGYFIEHRDGFHTTLFMLPIRDFCYAGYDEEQQKVISCQMYLPMPNKNPGPIAGPTSADFFNPLIQHVMEMIRTGRAQYPVERTLLTSGTLAAAMESLHLDGKLIETPHLDVKYTGPRKSQFWVE